MTNYGLLFFSNLSDLSEEEDPTEATLIYETKNVSKSPTEKLQNNHASSTIEKEIFDINSQTFCLIYNFLSIVKRIIVKFNY